MVPTLTEVLEVSDWQAPAEQAVAIEPGPPPLDEDILHAITQAVDTAIDVAIEDFRAQLRPRIEAAVRQVMAARQTPFRADD